MTDERLTAQPLQRFWLLVTILGLSCALSFDLCLFRIWYSGTPGYVFLNWNLLLAWIPFALAVLMWHVHRSVRRMRPLLVLLFAGWILFFPNSPYIVSDLIHLDHRHNVPMWFDLVMIFSYAWNGLLLGFLSLWIVQNVVASRFGWVVSWLMVGCTLAATGFGIYLGRFLRWNSWDLLVDPGGLLRDIAVRVANPIDYPQSIAVTVLYGAFLMVAYLTLTLLPAALRGAGSGDGAR